MIHNDSLFAQFSTVELTYDDLYLFSQNLSGTLSLKTGLTTPLIVLQTESTIVTVQIIAACWLTKIPFIAIPEKATPTEISSYLKDLNPNIIIGNEKFISDVKKSVGFIPSILSSTLLFDNFNDANSISLNKSVQTTDFIAESVNSVHNDTDSIFAYLFTSGTTDKPKCVPITRLQILSATESTRKNLPIDKSDQWLLTIPLNHIGGISIITRSVILGSSLRYIPKFDVEIVQKILSSESKVTFCSLVPTQLQKVMMDSSFQVHSKFNSILLGGGPIPESTIETARSRRIPVIPSFGMTETTAQCIAVPFPEMNSAPLNSCGKPLHGVEIQIRPPANSHEADSKNPGLLWVRGPQIIKQYLNKNDRQSFDEDGWFNTEDFAEIDSNGFVQILMRRTDRIVSGGENINPVEIENLILQMTEISEVSVVGLPDDIWGQKIVAVLPSSIAHHKVNPDDIKLFLKGKLAQFKMPKDIIVVESIPRTSSGKIKRFELIEMISQSNQPE